MKRLIILLLLITSLQGFSQVGFEGYVKKVTYRGVSVTQNLAIPPNVFTVSGTLKNYRWIAFKGDTLMRWSQSQDKWIAISTGAGASSDNFDYPLARISGRVKIVGLNTLGLDGQVPISTGTAWEYHYPFNGDSASRYSFETKGRLQVLEGGNNLDTLVVDGTEITSYVAKTSTYSVSATDHIIHCTSGTFTVTLPSATGNQGQTFLIKNTGAGTITVAGTIDGATNYTLTQNKYLRATSTGVSYIITGNN